MEEHQSVDVEGIDPPVLMHRERIDPEAVRELAESIREVGLLQPVLLRPRGKRFEVVAGHRRLLAHRLIGATTIKAIVRELNDRDTVVLRATENIQREDLSPMEQARVYGSLKDALEMSMDEIARKMGKNRITIKKYLRLLDLPEYVQDYVDKGVLSLLVALKLCEIEDEQVQRYYVTCAVEHGITGKVADMWMQDYEATVKAAYYEQEVGGGEPGVVVKPAPIYMTCFKCHGAAEVDLCRNVQICPGCFNEILLARIPSGKKEKEGV